MSMILAKDGTELARSVDKYLDQLPQHKKRVSPRERLHKEIFAFKRAIRLGSQCPHCMSTIQHKGDQYRCPGCGFEIRLRRPKNSKE